MIMAIIFLTQGTILTSLGNRNISMVNLNILMRFQTLISIGWTGVRLMDCVLSKNQVPW